MPTATVWAFTDLNGSVTSTAFADGAGDFDLYHRRFTSFGEVAEAYPDTGLPAEKRALFEATDIVWKGRFVDDVYRGSGNGASDATTVLHLIDGRFYNPTIQRFFTPGPVSLEQPNAYLLGGNDPLNRGPRVDWTTLEGPDPYSNFFYRGFGEGVRSAVGDDFLAAASTADLLLLTSAGVVGGVLAGEAAFALSGSLLLAGAVGGAAEFGSLRIAAGELGGNLNDLSVGTLAEFTVGGAIGGVVGGVVSRAALTALAPAAAPIGRSLARGFDRLPVRAQGFLREATRIGQTRIEFGFAQAPSGVVALNTGLPVNVRVRPPHAFRRPTVEAVLEIEGRLQLFEDVNQVARRASISVDDANRQLQQITGDPHFKLANARSVDAEIGTFLQAAEAGVRGGRGTLLVSGKRICPFCTTDIPSVARAIGLEELTVIDLTRGRTVTLAGDDLLPVSEGGISLRRTLGP